MGCGAGGEGGLVLHPTTMRLEAPPEQEAASPSRSSRKVGHESETVGLPAVRQACAGAPSYVSRVDPDQAPHPCLHLTLKQTQTT